MACQTPLNRLKVALNADKRYSDDQPRDSGGRFGSGGGSSSSSSSTGGSHTPITSADLADKGEGATSGPGASRSVSQDEFNKLADEGQQRLSELNASSPTTGLDKNFGSIKSDAYEQVQKSWGGATYDAHTGEAVTGDEAKYAMTVNPPGTTGISIPDTASQDEFNSAMDQAKSSFGSELSKSQRCLGVFHNDDAGTIEIDPSLVVDNLHDVDTIGAYTHAAGGAYNFADGNGYFPPHVATSLKAAA